MDEPPRSPDASILPARRIAHLLLIGATMAAGTLGLLSYATGWLEGGQATTLAFTTFVFFQVANALNVRDERRSLFARDTFRNRRLWGALAAVAVLQVVAVEVSPLQGIFDTTGLPASAWAVAVAVALLVVVVEESRKAIVRALG
jgi:Ca2+-transporting ATPase